MYNVTSISPIKIKDYIIKQEENYLREPASVYGAFSAKDNKLLGEIVCIPSSVYRNGVKTPSLYVEELFSFDGGKGIGTALLDFAQILSKNAGCEGNFHLLSSTFYLPQKVPHIFYKKYGMNTGNEKIDKKLDKFIKQGKTATYKDFRDINMFYPPVKCEKHKISFQDIFKNFFKRKTSPLIKLPIYI